MGQSQSVDGSKSYKKQGRGTCGSFGSVVKSVAKGQSRRIRRAFFPLAGMKETEESVEERKELRKELLELCNGVSITDMRTRDGLRLDAVWSSPADKKPIIEKFEEKRDGKKVRVTRTTYPEDKGTGGCVILFHGNGMTLDNFGCMAYWLHQRDVSVLLVTMRGYPGSEGDIQKDGEIGLYYDVEAAVTYALEEKKVDKDKLLVHGYSMGGSMAAAAAYYFDLPVVLDHTFTSTAAVSATFGKLLSNHIPRNMGAAVAQGVFRAGKTQVKDRDNYANPKCQDQRSLMGETKFISDGLDSITKIGQLKKDVFVIYGTADEMMPTDFADQFFEARYGPPPLATAENRQALEEYNRLKFNRMAICEGGGHCDVITQYRSECSKYRRFLQSIGLLRTGKSRKRKRIVESVRPIDGPDEKSEPELDEDEDEDWDEEWDEDEDFDILPEGESFFQDIANVAVNTGAAIGGGFKTAGGAIGGAVTNAGAGMSGMFAGEAGNNAETEDDEEKQSLFDRKNKRNDEATWENASLGGEEEENMEKENNTDDGSNDNDNDKHNDNDNDNDETNTKKNSDKPNAITE